MKKLSEIHNTFSSNLTNIRLEQYKISFNVNNNHELIGTYLWGQQVSGSLYPLFHFVELFIRNSIDNALKLRIGEFWWEKIDYNKHSKPCNSFFKNIEDAKAKLRRKWVKSEKDRLKVKWVNIALCPPLTHDQIIASTDFSTWTQILTSGFSAPAQNKNKYIWPLSLGKIFPQYNLLNTSSKDALQEIHYMLDEIREYRNRVFHHEPFWIKGKTSHLSSVSAIKTISAKITKMEKIIELLGKKLHSDVMRTNIFNNARRICSIEYLNVYQSRYQPITTTRKQKRTLRKKIPTSFEHTNFFDYADNIYVIQRII